MTRRPDPKSKTAIINLDARLGAISEDELRGFKDVCLRDGYQMQIELAELIRGWLRVHHWPPGNPQTLISNHIPGLKLSPTTDIPGARVYEVKVICEFCGQQHTGHVICAPPSEAQIQ